MSLAFVFPGQGSQKIGMSAELYSGYAIFKSVFDEASSALDVDLWDIVANGPEEKINSTEITQPIMLAAGVATFRLALDLNHPAPSIMAGHSLGEYTALVCAGVIEFQQAVKLVNARGMYMQQAVPPGSGAMAAILGLEDDAVRQACKAAAANGIVEAVNYNSPGQVVIAGEKNAVEQAVAQATQAGAKRAVLLPVSVPSHCQLMKPAADKLASDLAQITFNTPVIPVINNVDVATPTDPAAIKDALIRQLYQPVRWVEIIEAMAARGVDTVVECGPGKVLLGLNKRIDKTLTHNALADAGAFAG